MNPDSLLEYTAHQGELLTRMAQQAETLGFCVVMHDVNPHTHNTRLFGFLGGGFGQMFDTWCRTHGRKYVRVNVWFTNPIPPMGTLSDHVCLWKFELPRTKRMRLIVVALDLVCDVIAGNPTNHHIQFVHQSSSRPISVQRSDRHEYSGNDRASLELVLGILRSDNAREILTDRYTPKLPLKR